MFVHHSMLIHPVFGKPIERFAICNYWCACDRAAMYVMFNTGERLLCKSRHGKQILVNVTRNNKLNVINLELKKGSVIVGREAFYLSASAPVFTYSCSEAKGNTVSLMLASEEQFSFHPRSDYQQGYNTISIALLSLKKCIILFAFAKSEDCCTQRREALQTKMECRWDNWLLPNMYCMQALESFAICFSIVPVTTHFTLLSFWPVYVAGLICRY